MKASHVWPALFGTLACLALVGVLGGGHLRLGRLEAGQEDAHRALSSEEDTAPTALDADALEKALQVHGVRLDELAGLGAMRGEMQSMRGEM
jgi:hypothetical protein